MRHISTRMKEYIRLPRKIPISLNTSFPHLTAKYSIPTPASQFLTLLFIFLHLKLKKSCASINLSLNLINKFTTLTLFLVAASEASSDTNVNGFLNGLPVFSLAGRVWAFYYMTASKLIWMSRYL